MAKGRKTGGRNFTSADMEYFIKGGKNKALPPELKEARKARRVDIEIALEQFMSMTNEQLKKYKKRPACTQFERYVIAVIENGIRKGDQARLGFLFDNWVGPVTKRVELEAVTSSHKSIVEQIEEEE